jgi:hypothetical protein
MSTQTTPRAYGLIGDSGWDCNCDCDLHSADVDCEPLNAPAAGKSCGPCFRAVHKSTPEKLLAILGRRFVQDWGTPDVAEHLRRVWVLAKTGDPRWSEFLTLWRKEAPEELLPAVDLILEYARPAAPAESAEMTDGMYMKVVRQADGSVLRTIYKVQYAVHGSGYLYAKALVLGAPGQNARFVMARGAIKILTPEMKMTLEQAKEFGALYGTCCRCGRTLTDEDSIEAGIGPICAGKF